MKPPIIADNRGDLCVFDTVRWAESYMDPVDVRNGEYVVFDSEGLLLTPRVEDKDRRERIVLKPEETIPTHANDLRTKLLYFLSRTKFGSPGMEELTLAQLIVLMPRTGRPPRD